MVPDAEISGSEKTSAGTFNEKDYSSYIEVSQSDRSAPIFHASGNTIKMRGIADKADILNVKGERIITLIPDQNGAALWDIRDPDIRTGIYILKLHNNGRIEHRQIVVIK